MQFIDRPATHSTYYPNRPVTGIVLHDTETTYPITTQQSLGGWHYLIDRDGTLYRDCDEEQAAWHVRACDRWRPPWIVNAPDDAVSPPNYCTIGIEIVSDATARANGVPFTNAEYATVTFLLADLFSRYGPLPAVGHGQLQLDRSDPVDFDWARAGFGAFKEGWGYLWHEEAPLKPEPSNQVTVLQEALRLANLQKHEFEFYIVDLDHRKSVDEDAAEKGISPQQDMLQWAQDHFDAGEEAP